MKTLKQLRDQVRADLDFEDDDFIIDSDINTWIREAVRQAESQIHTLYERYFLVESQLGLYVQAYSDTFLGGFFTATNAGPDGNSIELVFDDFAVTNSVPISTIVDDWNTANPTNTVSYNGNDAQVASVVETVTLSNGAGGDGIYDYPSDIFANKIVKMVFDDGTQSTSHAVKRVKDLAAAKHEDLHHNDSIDSILTWLPVNDATNGRKIRIFPQQARSGNLNIFYVRNAKELQNDNDVCDIDEFQHFIVQYAKTQAYLKDGDPRWQVSKSLEEQYKNDMIETLSNMSPDDDNELDMDLDHYWDSI